MTAVTAALRFGGNDTARLRPQDRQCGSKVGYLSEACARNAAILHGWAGRPGMEAYLCGWCADWHVGHPPGSGRRRRGSRGGRRRA